MRMVGNTVVRSALFLCLTVLALACAGREKERHREMYLEFLDNLDAAFQHARGTVSEEQAVLPTTPYEAQQVTANIDKSNLDSKKLIGDLKALDRLEPLDETEREIANRVSEAAILFNYYLSFRVMGPLVIVNMTPATRSRFKLDSIRDTNDFVTRVEQAIADSRAMLREW